jgi:hypothetical protein
MGINRRHEAAGFPSAPLLLYNAAGGSASSPRHTFRNEGTQSSRPGESHPRPLTEPYVTVSRHAALLTQPPSYLSLVVLSLSPSSSRFRLALRKGRVSQPLRSAPITGVSPLLRVDPPPCRASILSLLRVLRLRFSLRIAATGSHVPHNSLISGHAAFMPEAACPLHRFAACLSRCNARSSLSTSFITLATPQRRFSYYRLPISHLTESCLAFSWNVHRPDSLSEQLPVVWDLRL